MVCLKKINWLVVSFLNQNRVKLGKKRGKLGGQNKVPRLSNSREHLDDILEMIGALETN